MLIRRAAAADHATILAVHAAAFGGQPADATPESRLITWLSEDGDLPERFSFVAEVDGAVVGHVCASPGAVGRVRGVPGIGPLGVRPERQHAGVGSALMHTLLGALDAADSGLVCLLGEPRYYRRFGFRPSTELGIEPPQPAWGQYFQARALAGHSPALRGTFRYAKAFDRLES